MAEYLNEELDQYLEDNKRNEVKLTHDSLMAPINVLKLVEATLITPQTPTGEAIQIMQKHHFGALLVAENDQLVGIVTERDLLMKVLMVNDDYEEIPVSELMTPDPESLEDLDPIAFALQKMVLGGYRHIPIIDQNGKPLYILSVRDIAGYISQFFEATLANLPPRPIRTNQERYGG